MIGPDQDLSQFPPWVWPYIHTVNIAKSHVFVAKSETLAEAIPQEVVQGHYAAIVQAVQLKIIATRIEGAVGAQLGKAASQALMDELDDWCGTKPHPHPHRIAQMATHLAVLAASSTNEQLRTELTSTIDQMNSRIVSR